MSAKPWGEAHRREALRRTYEIAAELIGAGLPGLARGASEQGPWRCRSENEWRDVVLFGAGLDAARIDREVARVRGLAEGRLVRERGYRVGDPDEPMMPAESFFGADAERDARDWLDTHPGLVLVRVTRIRRA